MYHLFFIRCLKIYMVNWTYKILYCMLKALKMSAFFTTTLFIKAFLVFTTIIFKDLKYSYGLLSYKQIKSIFIVEPQIEFHIHGYQKNIL